MPSRNQADYGPEHEGYQSQDPALDYPPEPADYQSVAQALSEKLANHPEIREAITERSRNLADTAEPLRPLAAEQWEPAITAFHAVDWPEHDQSTETAADVMTYIIAGDHNTADQPAVETLREKLRETLTDPDANRDTLDTIREMNAFYRPESGALNYPSIPDAAAGYLKPYHEVMTDYAALRSEIYEPGIETGNEANNAFRKAIVGTTTPELRDLIRALNEIATGDYQNAEAGRNTLDAIYEGVMHATLGLSTADPNRYAQGIREIGAAAAYAATIPEDYTTPPPP